MNRASLSFIFFKAFSVSEIPGTRLVELALSVSYFSKIVRTFSLSFENSFLFLLLFFMEISTFLSISKTLSFREKSERGKPCAPRKSMTSALAAL